MSMFRIRALAALCLFAVATSASAVVIEVDSTADLMSADFTTDTSPNTSVRTEDQTEPVQLARFPEPGIPRNGTPGACTLREAIMSVNGDVATAPEECYNDDGDQTGLYCPFRFSTEIDPTASAARIANECEVVPPGEPVEIHINIPGPVTIPLDYALPPIRQPVRIVGLGFNQTAITGDAAFLARLNPPATPADGVLDQTIDVPMFQVATSLPASAQVTLERLQVRGVRVHHFRAAAAGTAAVEPNKRIVNFGGIYMDNGGVVTEPRKQLNLVDTLFTCNRRDLGAAVGSRPEDTTGEAPVAVAPGANGAAVTVLGRAALNLNTVRFSNNVADFGAGGAIFGGARDAHSPSLTMSGANSVFDESGSCTGFVFATEGTNVEVACNGSASQPDICPASAAALIAAQSPGNIAGTESATGAVAELPDAAVAGRNGGAIAVDATATAATHIGAVNIADAQFINSNAAGRGGAVSLVNVARTATTDPAFAFDNTLFTDSTALSDGGALFIQGHNVTAAAALMEFVSFGDNTATGKGGAIYYVTTAGRPIDFTLENVRFSGNSAGAGGGAIFAEDNGSDDSGLLNISKATFSNNDADHDDDDVQTGNGGAIFCGATKAGSQFTNLTFSGNAALNGGAIHVGNRCHVDINSSTITNNLSTFEPAASTRAFDPGDSSATPPVPASVSYSNRGQGLHGGGGIFVASNALNARVDVRNTILSGNLAIDFQELNPPTVDVPPTAADSDGAGGADCSAANDAVLRSAALSDPSNGGFNFVGSARGCGAADTSNRPFLAGRHVTTGNCVNPSPQTGDWVGGFTDERTVPHCSGAAATTAAPLDARLRVLQDNGGPDILGAHNFTHAPEVNSPASVVIDAGQQNGCIDGLGAPVDEDEREAARGTTQSGRCDIGAVEIGSVSPNPQQVRVTAELLDNNGPVQLSSTDETPFEMMRVTIEAPEEIPVSLKSVRIRGEIPAGGTPGSYSSVVGMRIFTIDAFGNRSAQPIYDGPAPASVNGTVDATFSSPIALDRSEEVTLSIYYVYGTSSQLAMGATGTMLALGGLGALPLFGLVGARRRRLMLTAAFAAVVVVAVSGCDSDSSGGGQPPGPPNTTDRTFRASLVRVDYDAGSSAPQPVQQAVVPALAGPTITVQK